MDLQQSIGLAHLMAQSDGVGKTLLVVLLLMSVTTWYLIVTKAWSWLRERRRTQRFLGTFWNSSSLDAVAAHVGQHPADEPFSHLAAQAIVATRHHQRQRAHKLDETGGAAEFVTRSIRRVIDEETARLESGLTVLASIGSTAPFIGLFGTVWGVYHALLAIGMSGQGTLDKVAGPVGEALMMTALGLAVAIPAVLAYNFSARRNRMILAQLDSFAHDVFALLTTGSHVAESASVAPLRTAPPATRAL